MFESSCNIEIVIILERVKKTKRKRGRKGNEVARVSKILTQRSEFFSAILIISNS
jgi:hypothetical protein